MNPGCGSIFLRMSSSETENPVRIRTFCVEERAHLFGAKTDRGGYARLTLCRYLTPGMEKE